MRQDGVSATEPWNLAVDLFWLSQDDHSGKALLPATRCGLGIGSALLAELTIAEYVRLDDDLVVPIGSLPPPNTLADQVFTLMLTEPAPLPLGTWLSYLSRTARDDVGRYLEGQGLVHEHRSRLRRSTKWPPTDLNAAGKPESTLRLLVMGGRPWSVTDSVLCCLSDATGLLGHVLGAEDSRSARLAIPTVTDRLPPMIRSLLRHTRAALSAAVLSERR
ncbi:hypothetical protein GIY23_09060 [Allosaccharopolyspora coralli]|uniref:GPP34 family phosphoprotein n=1 Tax=Allosaccharopolyspora coralli TaxID=2665642 RepID=A0A5Q3Q883_9PSEU|nr:hypothetical protein GIY23_09060 [Allosaccharopolyspora coralli]